MKTLNKEMIHSGGLFLLSIVTAYFFYTSISLPLLGQLYLIDSEGKMLCLYLSHIVFFLSVVQGGPAAACLSAGKGDGPDRLCAVDVCGVL